MRKRVHEIMGLPPEFHEDGAPEYTPLPDEFNRFSPASAEAVDTSSRLRKMKLLLAAAGLSVLGFLSPVKGKTAEAAQEPIPAAAVPVSASATPSKPAIVASTPAPEQEPDAEVMFYVTSSVFHGQVRLTSPERTVAVQVQIRFGSIPDPALTYDFTPEDIAAGEYILESFDYSAFYLSHREAFEAETGNIVPCLEVTLTYRDEDGQEQTRIRREAPQPEDWVNLSYDAPDEDMSWFFDSSYPDCFVARVYDSAQEAISFTMDPAQELQYGDVFVSISVEGRVLVTDEAYLQVSEQTYTSEDGPLTLRTFMYVIPRPADFPEHGRAHFTVIQHLVHYDTTLSRQWDYSY